MNKDTLILENTLTLSGIAVFMMDITPILTACVLTTALILNLIKMFDWFKNKK
jgi:hypothetical protein